VSSRVNLSAREEGQCRPDCTCSWYRLSCFDRYRPLRLPGSPSPTSASRRRAPLLAVDHRLQRENDVRSPCLVVKHFQAAANHTSAAAHKSPNLNAARLVKEFSGKIRMLQIKVPGLAGAQCEGVLAQRKWTRVRPQAMRYARFRGAQVYYAYAERLPGGEANGPRGE